jgi:hypothetical protein
VQVDVGEDGAGNAPLRGPDERTPRLLPPQVARPECFPDQADEAVVRDPLLEQGDQDVVIDLVVRFDILIPLSKTQVIDLAIAKFLEPSQRGRFVREQIQTPLGIFNHLNGAIVDAIMNPMQRDVQVLRDLR